MARPVVVDVDEVVRSVLVDPGHDDPTSTRILDAASELFATEGIRRCSVEEIAERSGLGRTTVYRHFDGRNQIVQAVLVRECRRFFGSILVATSGAASTFEDVVIEAFVAGLRSVQTSRLAELVRTEPDLAALLTVDGSAVIGAATDVLVQAFGRLDDPQARERVAATAELLVRLAISLVVSGPGEIPGDDTADARRTLHTLLDPLLVPLATLRTEIDR